MTDPDPDPELTIAWWQDLLTQAVVAALPPLIEGLFSRAERLAEERRENFYTRFDEAIE